MIIFCFVKSVTYVLMAYDKPTVACGHGELTSDFLTSVWYFHIS
jgi:hypothetical protein